MNRLIKSTLYVTVAFLLLQDISLMAQGGGGRNRNAQGGQGGQGGRGGRGGNQGNFDPAQMQQLRMDRYKQTLEITDENEWKAIQVRLQAVLDAQQEVRSLSMGMGGGRGGRGGGGPGGPGGQGGQGGLQNANANQRGGGPGRTVNAAVAELQKAIDDKAPSDVIKAKLAVVRDARKAAEAKLLKAQQELQALITVRQEAISVLSGTLN